MTSASDLARAAQGFEEVIDVLLPLPEEVFNA